MPTKAESNPKIDAIIAKASKKYGAGTLIKGSQLKGLELPRTTTGSLALDIMLGGGWPLNQWNELIGNESNGKTVVALKTIAANQALDPDYEALWVDSEGFDPVWAAKLGVDLDRLTISTTNIMEQAFQIVVDMLDARAVDAIVIDSLPALTTQAEQDRLMEEFTVGVAAKLTNQFVRKSGSAGKRSLIDEDRDCLIIFINQWRSKIGVMYGDPRTTPGGMGKNFAYFTRVELARDEWINAGTGDNKVKVGMTIKARTMKNKTAPPQRQAYVDFYFDDCTGFSAGDYDPVKEAFNLGMSHGVIERKGAWYHYGGEKWNGKDDAWEGIRQDVGLRKQLGEDVMKVVESKYKVSTTPTEEDADPGSAE